MHRYTYIGKTRIIYHIHTVAAINLLLRSRVRTGVSINFIFKRHRVVVGPTLNGRPSFHPQKNNNISHFAERPRGKNELAVWRPPATLNVFVRLIGLELNIDEHPALDRDLLWRISFFFFLQSNTTSYKYHYRTLPPHR